MSSDSAAAHAIVHGYVQGVGFRYTVFRWARRAQLYGWVRNRSDGTVEISCEGSSAVVEEFHGWLTGGGPPFARIDQVEWHSIEPPGYGEFRIR